MSERGPQHPLRLRSLVDPRAPEYRVEPGGSARIGRALDCEVCISESNVSRHHGTVMNRGDRWFLTDAGSRAGTHLNGVKLPAGHPAPLATGDLIRIGSWVLRVEVGEGNGGGGGTIATVDDTGDVSQPIETIAPQRTAGVAQHRLMLLLDYAAELNAAKTERELAEAVVRCALAGSGYGRAAVLRSMSKDGKVEVVASSEAGGFPISRSLVQRASVGEVASLGRAGVSGDINRSLVELGIHSALCVPLREGPTIHGYLYLDARGSESMVRTDATDFCVALTQLTGVAAANLRRSEIERRQSEIESQLRAAREAQQFIVPAKKGRSGPIVFAAHTVPGLVVAGDLFDVVTRRDGTVAVCIGDVTGEGIGAGILMAATQSHLHAMLSQGMAPGEAMTVVNRYLIEHSPADRFVSIWIGLFDGARRTLTFADAGHGHWLIVGEGGARRHRGAGGIPAGIDETVEYGQEDVALGLTERIVLLSDGVLEQRSPSGEEFGSSRVDRTLVGSVSSDEDCERILSAVRNFAGGEALDDDTTVASVSWAR